MGTFAPNGQARASLTRCSDMEAPPTDRRITLARDYPGAVLSRNTNVCQKAIICIWTVKRHEFAYLEHGLFRTRTDEHHELWGDPGLFPHFPTPDQAISTGTPSVIV